MGAHELLELDRRLTAIEGLLRSAQSLLLTVESLAQQARTDVQIVYAKVSAVVAE